MWSVGILAYELYYSIYPYDALNDDFGEYTRTVRDKSVIFHTHVSCMIQDPVGVSCEQMVTFAPMSEALQALIRGLLEKPPHCRLSLQEAIQHPFLANI